MGREIEIEPNEAQRKMLESMGFKYDRESNLYPFVTWRGHGIVVHVFQESDVPSLEQVAKAIASEAKALGAHEVRSAMKQAIGISQL